jgi:hypothetical protein
LSTKQLLTANEYLAGNLRYTRDAHATLLLGDCPYDQEVASATTAARLLRWLENDSSVGIQSDPSWCNVLADTGYAWSKREDIWTTSINGVELQAYPRVNGIQVRSLLISTDGLAAVSVQALMEFLLRSQASLRFARVELSESSLQLTAFADAENIEFDLLHAVSAVVAASRFLQPEIRALESEPVASAYLEVVGRVDVVI